LKEVKTMVVRNAGLTGGDMADGKFTSRRSPYEQMKNAIVVGDFAPGQLLTESALASEYDTSRTPIREALTRLEQDGLISRTSRGLVVRERSPGEILDIYEVRIVLEATAARVAAARRTPMDVLNLKRISKHLEQLKTDDEAIFASENRKFHRALWQATHNEALLDLLERLDLHLVRYPATTLARPGRWEESNIEHSELVAAIEAGDSGRAGEVAARHFSEARDLRLAIWAESGE
jgi:DNA-binding GntR family transcriptional regulator